MTDCSICIERLKCKKSIYTLSCGHKFHYDCYMKCVFNNHMNIFINCPLCREMNFTNKRLYNDPLPNIKLLNPTHRCICKTKEGKRCRNRSHILNYGLCYIHHKDILSKDKYNVMCNFIYWLLETKTPPRTKISMVDIAKKLCNRHPEINDIQDILYYFYRFYYYNQKVEIVDKYKMYEYYELDRPNEDWFDKCLEKNIII